MKKLLCAAFALVLLQSNAMAAQCLGCEICYRCTREDSSGCCIGTCVYDEAYCNQETECIDCAAGQICEMWINPGCCVSCAPDTEIQECDITAYWNPTTMTCVPCPLDSDCTAQSDGNDGVTSCFLSAQACKKQNTKGSYEFSSNCHYSDFNTDIGGDAGSGDMATEEDEPV